MGRPGKWAENVTQKVKEQSALAWHGRTTFEHQRKWLESAAVVVPYATFALQGAAARQ